MNVFGRVYMSTVGRGLVYGESDQTCVPSNVTPYIKVNAESVKKLWITTVNGGDDVLLSPEPAATGTWSWSGPEGFSSSTREVTISNIQPAQAGIYKATYTNASGCKSSVQTFTINVTEQYTLTTTTSPTVGGTVTGAGTYNSGTAVTVTATPATGYTFTGWSGDASGTSASITVTMNSNKSVTANFEAITYTLTTTASPTVGGTVTGAGTYNSGTAVTVTAIPATGYIFTGWSGDASGTSASITVTMNSNKSVTANFEAITYTLTTTASPIAGGTITGAGTYNSGTAVTVTALPATGYIFTGWSGDASGTSASTEVTMSSNKSVTANFQVESNTTMYELSATVVPAAGGVVTGTGTYPDGTVVTISAESAPGYTFIGWSGDISGTSAAQTITMSSAIAVQANFQSIGEFALKIPKLFSPDNHGDISTETWNIENAYLLDGCEIMIFNRQGQKVYSSLGYVTPWDGTSNGQPLPNGAYFYIIRYSDNKKLTGSVTIARLK